MDKDEVIKKVEQYAILVKDYILTSQIILYGSYVNGDSNPDSDIDVAVVVDKLNQDFLDTVKML
jgi:predicted nucleotidyltransferase